jgi:hypothetical protein
MWVFFSRVVHPDVSVPAHTQKEEGMLTKKFAVVACLVVLGAIAVAADASFGVRHTNYITFSKPVRLPGTVLGSGTYIFELPVPDSAHSVVSVLSVDRKHVYYTGHTVSMTRPEGMPRDQVISLAEARADAPAPVRVWWPLGERNGHQFMYPDAR